MVKILNWWDPTPLVQNLNDCSLYSRLILLGWCHSMGWNFTAAIFLARVIFGWLLIKNQFLLDILIVLIDFGLSDENGFSEFLDSGLGYSLYFSLEGELLVVKFVDVQEVGRAVKFREHDFEGRLLVVFVSELKVLFRLGCLSRNRVTYMSYSMMSSHS